MKWPGGVLTFKSAPDRGGTGSWQDRVIDHSVDYGKYVLVSRVQHLGHYLNIQAGVEREHNSQRYNKLLPDLDSYVTGTT